MTGLRGTCRAVLTAALAGALALPGPRPLEAQEVRFADPPRSEPVRALAAFLDRGGYALWTRDTVLARADTVRGSVLVLEASVRVSGRIEGDVYVVDGDLFLRTGGSVGGDVAVLGGGFYDSDLAEVEGRITYRPNERIRVRPSRGDYEVITEVEPRPYVELDGTYGVHIPVYQRVDALVLGWGGLLRAPYTSGRPELEGIIRYTTGPERFEGSVRASWYLSDRVRVGLAASRATRTNDGWIRPTWYNSLATLVAEDDARDYHRADRAAIELEWRAPTPPLWEDAPEWRLALSGGWEEARSRAARDIWTLFGDDDEVSGGVDPAPGFPHPNPAIDDGDLYFGTAAFEWDSRGRSGRTAFGVGLEAAHDDDIEGGDFSFLLAEARVSARRATSWGHAWDVFVIARAELAGTLPGQRYSTIGGVGTIPTLDLRSRRGPRLVYADASYAIPILGLPTLGGLDAFVRASAGGTWAEGRALVIDESLAGGLAVRLWDFQMELGAAVGSDPGPDEVAVVPFLDVRVRRSARPTRMPRPGRGR